MWAPPGDEEERFLLLLLRVRGAMLVVAARKVDCVRMAAMVVGVVVVLVVVVAAAVPVAAARVRVGRGCRRPCRAGRAGRGGGNAAGRKAVRALLCMGSLSAVREIMGCRIRESSLKKRFEKLHIIGCHGQWAYRI